MVKFGKPVLQVPFKRIKVFVLLFVLLFLLVLILSFNLLFTAVKIRSHLGSFINMISSGDGEVLPSLLALPVFLFLCLDCAIFFFIYKIFSKKKSPGVNRLLFLLILVAAVLMVTTLIIVFVTLGHVFGSSKSIEDGIINAMAKYELNSLYKKLIDRLQIEFQCCGSNKYDDWYNITWLEKSTSTNSSTSQSGKTPFSCCAIKTKFPCIHFDIESTGVNYLYTPEFNLSISGTGCHTRIVETKRQIGMGIVASLFLYMFLECLLLVPARFLQTGHSVDFKFEGNSKSYIVWLIGSYAGKNQSNGPPEPPPVPPDLMN
ncbi:hypothetical protein HUJ04_013120 [Dendroctonus ponderosae]|uniref:Tetraspanin n=1 Tax=Dendroctonus ponderosae TaxID=77166 RepID=A0AAR5QFU6_DENPD|nr:hypothetical protein HUJ04_013120 [Dendroctonus ponderosae]